MTKGMIKAAALAAALLSSVALAKETKTTMKVSGWHCGGCASKTEDALKKVDGVTAVSTDSDKGECTVTYDDKKANQEKLEAAVVSSGFKVEKAAEKAAPKAKN
jgi:Cu+-exporting ATPase